MNTIAMMHTLTLLAVAWADSGGTPTPPSAPSPAVPSPVLHTDAKSAATPNERDSVLPLFTLRHDIGDGVGFRNGFSYAEGFIPVWQIPGESIIFANVRAVNYDDARYWEGQVGGGVRFLVSDSAILGLNAFYDGRNTDTRFFNQVGLGWELLGSRWEARGNVYIPVGPQRGLVADHGFSGPQFVGTNIALEHNRLFDSSMNGVDFEIGRSFKLSESIEPRFYVGGYHYSNERVQTANGVRARMETRVGENVTAFLQIQNDAVFNTTVFGGLGITFGGPRRGYRERCPLEAKLGQRVVRDPNIVIQRKLDSTRELAINPATGLPIEIRHVASNAAGGGDGSVERPFQTLAQAQASSGPGQIVFAHAGSVFQGQGLALKPNQRFLGEGIPHLFASTQGTYLLPRATAGTALPLLTNGPGNAIRLASGTEVSGLHLNGTAGNAIFGQNVADVNVNRNRISNAVGGGIVLDNVRGQSFLLGNTIQTVSGGTLPGPFAVIPNVGAGIYVSASGSTRQVVNIRGNTISDISGGARAFGVVILTDGSASVRALVNRNQLSNLTATDVPFGIAAQALGTSSLIAQLGNNSVRNLTGGLDQIGINVSSVGQSQVGLQLVGNVTQTPPRIDLISAGGIFRVENTLGTNTPAPSLNGPIVTVPVGTFGFGAP